MKAILLTLLLNNQLPAGSNYFNSYGYLVGAFLALCILAYLVYSLVKPDKF
jgi:hypothetical protein